MVRARGTRLRARLVVVSVVSVVGVVAVLGSALVLACGLDTQGSLDTSTCDACDPRTDGAPLGEDVLPADALDDAPGDGARDAAPNGDASREATTIDGGADASIDPGDGACPSLHGPSMVRAATANGTSFCIDSTEVTNGQYALFVFAAGAGAVPTEPAECGWNARSFGADPPDLTIAHLAFPVMNIDWCDARAFCEWSGKRLCGKRVGGAELGLDLVSASTSQWFAACSAAGTKTYPYGQTYSSTACIGEKASASATSGAGTASCVGGSPGLFDMSGNAAEWTDSCEPVTGGGSGASSKCSIRGGGASDTMGGLTCTSSVTAHRDTTQAGIGFRCCSL